MEGSRNEGEAMPIFNGLVIGEKEISFRDEAIVQFLNPINEDGMYMSAKVALQNSDIYSAVNQLSSDLATVKIIADNNRTRNIIQNPCGNTNAHAFWQAIFAQLLLGGEAFAYRWRNVNGLDVRLEYLRPSQVSVMEISKDELVYNISFDDVNIGVKEAVPVSDVLHFRLMSIDGGKTGLSPLYALTSELNIKKSSNRLTKNALTQSVMSPGVLKVTKGGLLDANQKATRSREFVKQVRASNNGPIVIDDLEEYKPLEVKSNVAQLLSQTDWTGKQIAKVYGIPDSYLNGQGDQQSSLDQIKGMYLSALNRYSQDIVSELRMKFRGNIRIDLRPVIDPLGDSYATTLFGFTKNKGLAGNQATWLLQEYGYLPENLPEPEYTKTMKGGEMNGEDSD